MAWLLSLVLVRAALATDGLEPIGLSTQSLLRGGTDVAIGDSALSQIDNPATLTLNGHSIDASGELLMPRTVWRGSIDTSDSDVRVLPLGHIGLSLPQNDRVSFGLAAWSKDQIGSSFHLRTPTAPFTPRETHASMRDIGLGANTAFKVTDKLSLGGGLRLELITGEFTSFAGPAQIHFGRGYGLGAGFQLGMHYRITDRLTFGLGYRSPTWFQDVFGSHTSSSLTNRWQVHSPGSRPIHFGRSLVDNLTLPQKVLAGLAWEVSDRLRLSLEGRWINYRHSSMYKAAYDIDGSLGAQLDSMVGYRDQFAVMTGAEYKLSDHWTIGAGYHFATNPISQRSFLPIADMIVEHHLTAGLTYQRKHWWLGGGYVLGLPNSLTAARRTKILFGFDSVDGELRQSQHSVFLGGGYRW